MAVQTKPISTLVDVILGLQWGDEGKGKIVDSYVPQYDIIARINGGPNAGHTLAHEDIKCATHSLPSGVLDPDKLNLIGAGCVLNPLKLLSEISDIESKVRHSLIGRLFIAEESSLILPAHILLDQVQGEVYKLGTTLQGVGQSYTSFYKRTGLWTGLANNPKKLAEKYQEATKEILSEIAVLKQRSVSDFRIDEAETDQWLRALATIASKYEIVNCVNYVHSQMGMGRKILVEGAQGALLDPRFGCSYPFVTSSYPTAGGACVGLGIGPKNIRKVYGVTKAYTTRVGNGPFPTQFEDENSVLIGEKGNEKGSTTGRFRKIGWLDLPGLEYGIRMSGTTDVIMTKIDILGLLPEIKVCVRYENRAGKKVPFSPQMIDQLTPVYETFKGDWTGAGDALSYESLTGPVKDYIEFVESEIKTPITLVSNGEQTKKIFAKPTSVLEKV